MKQQRKKDGIEAKRIEAPCNKTNSQADDL
jgi:hypothetical protein